MTKYDLRERLRTTHSLCDEYCLYDLLECETQEEFEDMVNVNAECISIEVHRLKDLKDALKGLEWEEVHNEN